MPPRDVCYPYTYDYSWMYSFATKRTVTHPMAKYGPPPRSLVGSPASWAGELEGDRAHKACFALNTNPEVRCASCSCSSLHFLQKFPTMIRTTFVLLGLLAAVTSAFVPSARPSFGKSSLRVSHIFGAGELRCANTYFGGRARN